MHVLKLKERERKIEQKQACEYVIGMTQLKGTHVNMRGVRGWYR